MSRRKQHADGFEELGRRLAPVDRVLSRARGERALPALLNVILVRARSVAVVRGDGAGSEREGAIHLSSEGSVLEFEVHSVGEQILLDHSVALILGDLDGGGHVVENGGESGVPARRIEYVVVRLSERLHRGHVEEARKRWDDPGVEARLSGRKLVVVRADGLLALALALVELAL